MQVTWNGREVERQPWRTLVATLVLVILSISLMIFAIIMALMVILMVVSIPIHFLLRLAGRQGFYSDRKYALNYEGFRKA